MPTAAHKVLWCAAAGAAVPQEKDNVQSGGDVAVQQRELVCILAFREAP